MKRSKLMKGLVIGMALVTTMSLAACGQDGGGSSEDSDITVVSREEGSGTRDAFVELTGVLEDDSDRTVDTAVVANSTSVVTESVEGDSAAIGYVSLGSLSDTVKAVTLDGTEVSVDTVKSGDYKLQRPFNIVTGDNVSDVAQDFIDYVMSSDGQKIIEDEGYIAADEKADSYNGGGVSGDLVLAGSTSVAPVMEVIADSYKEINSDVSIEIQQTGTGAGIESTIEGVCDIGMASRDLNDDESDQGLKSEQIALDGIAVVVNEDNSVDDLTMEQIRDIYTGEITNWSEVE